MKHFTDLFKTTLRINCSILLQFPYKSLNLYSKYTDVSPCQSSNQSVWLQTVSNRLKTNRLRTEDDFKPSRIWRAAFRGERQSPCASGGGYGKETVNGRKDVLYVASHGIASYEKRVPHSLGTGEPLIPMSALTGTSWQHVNILAAQKPKAVRQQNGTF